MSIAAERKAIEALYDATCVIENYVTEENPITKETEVLDEPVEIYSGPCGLSQVNLPPTNQTDAENTINYDVKLFLPPEVVIEPGCIIKVTAHGRTRNYEQVGEPFIYATHQEVKMVRVGKA